MYAEDKRVLSLGACLIVAGFVMLYLSFSVSDSLRLALLFYGSILAPTGMGLFVIVWVKNIMSRPEPRLPGPEALELVEYCKEVAEIAEE